MVDGLAVKDSIALTQELALFVPSCAASLPLAASSFGRKDAKLIADYVKN